MKGRPRQPVPPCNYCNKEFKRQEHLDRHLRTHTKERPYACDCGRMFTRQDLLHRHHRLAQCNTTGSGDLSDTPSPLSTLHPQQASDAQHYGQPQIHQHAPETSAATAHQATVYQDIRQPHLNDAPSSLSMTSSSAQMTSFPLYDPPSELQAPHTGNGQHSSPMPLDLTLLDMDFVFDEAELINNHLAQSTHLPDLDLSSLNDEQSSCPDPVLEPQDADVESGLDVSRPMNQELPPNRHHHRVQPRSLHQILGALAGDHGQAQRRPSPPARPLHGLGDIAAIQNPWEVSQAAYERLTALLVTYEDNIETFHLPTRRTISRYVASWVRSYHPHLPVIHLPTNNFDLKSPVLLLTLAAVGSFYGFEHSNGYPMLFISRSVILEKLRMRHQKSSRHLLRSVPSYAKVSIRGADHQAETMASPQNSQEAQKPFDIELLQALLILVMSMAWLDKPLAHEAMALGSQLAQLTREALASCTKSRDLTTWVAWAKEEEKKRTIYSAYFTLNLLTICFKFPPLLSASEITLPLPSAEAEFRASDSEDWRNIRRLADCDYTLTFDQCFIKLLQGVALPQKGSHTEFGNYMLMQSLLTQIYFERQSSSSLLSSSSMLPTTTIAIYDTALSAWQSCWDSAIDTALDPSSLHGPLAFNSTAMLRLAHVHLAVDIQAHCSLAERDPKVLAEAFLQDEGLVILQSPHLHQALMHAINALRIPIRVGIVFVASGRTGHWSVQHAISNFSCALLLTQWLANIRKVVASHHGQLSELSSNERYFLSTVEMLVEETHLEDSLGAKDEYPQRIRRVAVAALRLWAETCKGAQVYEIVHIVGETLTRVADMLEAEN